MSTNGAHGWATQIGSAVLLWLLAGLAFGLAACAQSASPEVRPPTTTGVPDAKLAVDSDGLYRVPADLLSAVGFDLEGVRPEELTLSAGGEPVSFLVSGEGKNRAIEFYGQALAPSAYTGRNVYWLRRQPRLASTLEHVPTIEARSVGSTAGLALADVVSFTVHAEEQRHYLPAASTADDRWLWDPLRAPDEAEITISTPDAGQGAANLTVRLYGDSFSPSDPDHHLIITVNGTTVADAKWDGPGPYVLSASVEDGVLRSGDNLLRIQAPGDTDALADSVVLDWVEISYPRELVLSEDVLTFSGQAPGFAVRLRSGTSPAAVWDISDPQHPLALQDYRVQGNLLTFASDNTHRRYLVVTAAGLQKPAEVALPSNADLRDWPEGADMIIITVPQFRDALEPLVEARQAAGLRVAMLDVDDVYDTFSYGRVDPAAIRALVDHARSNWTPPAPRFLLLAGDASYDPRDYLGADEKNWVPTQQIKTTFTGWTPSDVWFALPVGSEPGGEPSRPALAVGRFPAQTVEQMEEMVAKTLAYEQGDTTAAWRHHALLLADNDEPGFAREAEAFAAALPAYTSTVVGVEGDGSQARADLFRELDEGVGMLGYFGHGSMNLWARERILGIEDVPRLTNRDRLPLVFTVTCLSGFFAHPERASLGEALLRSPNGGAVAALVPSSAAVLGDQRILAEQLARAFTDYDRKGMAKANGPSALGEVIQRAQVGLPQLSDSAYEVMLTFNLLGDPSLPLSH